MKRYESLSRMAKVYYGPSIPNFMIELPQSLTNTVADATTNTNSESNSKTEDKKVKELNPPAPNTQKTWEDISVYTCEPYLQKLCCNDSAWITV